MAVECTGSSGEEGFPRLGEVFDLLRVIWAVDHGMHAISKQMESRLGVTAPQRLALRIIGRFPGIPAGKLAELLRYHPGTLTGVLQRLERRGLLERRTDPRDRRRVLLGLTARGRTLDVLLPGTVESAVERAIAGLPRLKLSAAREVLEGLAAALEEETLAGARRDSPGKSGRRPEPLRRHGPESLTVEGGTGAQTKAGSSKWSLQARGGPARPAGNRDPRA
jgi:DNA-binding MarR family transcriptional regulator